MPVEGQWQRARTPFSRRERCVLAIFAVLAVAAAVAIGVVSVTSADPPAAAGCIRADVPSTMGGTRLEACGAKARALCRTTPGGVENAIVAACPRVGYATESP
jgi:hypothetical protein